MYVVKRSEHNPILAPDNHFPWKAYAAFNGCPIKEKNTTHLIFRAMSSPEPFENSHFSLSSIGHATSKDGIHFSDPEEFIKPEEDWERYGCEDPRMTKLGNKYFTFYTALSHFPFTAEGIRVAVAIGDSPDTISEKHLVTPFNAKAMTLFPEKINGKYTVIFTAHTDMPPSSTVIAQFNKIEDMWSDDYWEKWQKNIEKYSINLKRTPNERVEIGSPPLKTKYGWLLVYSHIQKYYTNDKVFGIEAVLLDLKNPQKIVGRTRGPLLIPEESYEKYGIIPNVIFPSGALIDEDEGILKIYYGGADTVCAVAEVDLDKLLKTMVGESEDIIKRSSLNPILKPTKNFWENQAVFNPAAIDLKGKIHLLYRAVSTNNTSVFGYAATKDGSLIIDRSINPAYVPRESFERKGMPNGNSGCEDARLTLIGETLYMCYTAYNGIEVPAVALTTIPVNDFVAQKWNWSKPILISPRGVDDKDACILPFIKNKKYFFIHRINHTIVATYIDIEYPSRSADHVTILEPRPSMWDSQKVGLSAPPLKTPYGWLMIYHGIAEDGVYRVGLALLDLKDPAIVLSRTTDFIFEPVEKYEKEGMVPNVVFPCGAVIRKNKLLLYYGGADRVIGLAEADINKLLSILV